MPRDTMESIERSIREAKLPEDKRVRLLEMLNELKREVESLSLTHMDDAKSIAGLTEESSRKAIEGEFDAGSLASLERSVESFEASHPTLVRTVNEISMMLSNIGI